VFQVNTDGTGFTNLHEFGFSDGAQPYSEVILSGGTLYGTTAAGGSPGNGPTVSDGSGVVFRLVLAPPPVVLDFRLISHAVVLSWTDPTVSLYTAPTITNVFTKITGATSPYTNFTIGTQQYFRLE
jgi:hypothetical protein